MGKDSFDLSVHHVGGRAGTMEFPALPPVFEKDLERVLYDADENCIEAIIPGARQVVLPYCISDHVGKEKFYLSADRYTSSLLTPAELECELESEDSIFHAVSQFGWDFDMRKHIDEVRELDVTTLDNIYINQPVQLNANSPDFLSLDVEGAEQKILNGSSKLLESKFLVVQCEFDSIDKCNSLVNVLKEYQFKMVDMNLFPSTFKYNEQLPIGLRGIKGNSTVGDITFIKEAQAIVENHANPLLDLLKIAFISFVLFKLNNMYAYIKEWKELRNSQEFLDENHIKKNYLVFLKAFIELMETYPQIVPLRFSSLFPTSESRSKRFSKNPPGLLIKELRKQYFQYVDLKEFKNFVFSLYNDEYIGIESLCELNGFKEHAVILKEGRTSSLMILLNRLGLLESRNNGKCAVNNYAVQNL